MKHWQIYAILPILVIICIGCVNNGATGNDILPTDKYVAIHETCYNNGKVLEGNYTFPPPELARLRFDPNSPSEYTTVNDSFKLLYGYTYMHSRPWAIDVNTTAEGIYTYNVNLRSGAIVTGISENGTISLLYDNQSIDLKPGEYWNSPVVATSIVNESFRNVTIPIKSEITWSITYMGLHDKTKRGSHISPQDYDK